MKFKRISLLILIILSAAVLLCSCNKNIKLEEYSIVYPENAGESVRAAAAQIKSKFASGIGELCSDSASANDKEILVGETARTETNALKDTLLYDDYVVKIAGQKLIIIGGSDSATAEAVNYFLTCYQNGNYSDIQNYSYHKDYALKSLKVSGNEVHRFNVVSAVQSEGYTAMVKTLEESIESHAGFKKGDLKDSLNIFLKCDKSLTASEYKIKVSQGDITLSAANAYGLNAATTHFTNEILVGHARLDEGFEFTGTVKSPSDRFDYDNYYECRQPLYNTYYKLVENKKLNIVYFGGSVTAGYGSSDAESTSWRALTSKWFTDTFPEAAVSSYNSAIGGSGSMHGAFRCAHDVLALKPDLVFIEFAINDLYCGTSESNVKKYYESIIRQIKTAYPDCDIISLYTIDQSSASSGTLPIQTAAEESVAKHYNIPSISIGAALTSDIDCKDNAAFSEYFTDIVHPNDKGYRRYFEIIREYLEYELVFADAQTSEAVEYTLANAISADGEFSPKYILANEIDIVSSNGWSLSNESYWTTANPYSGYLYPTSDENELVIRFTGSSISLFAQYGSGNRIFYSIDGGSERVQNQKGNHPLLLTSGLQNAEHTLTIRAELDEENKSYMISALLVE